jgi:hypothetical protein
VSDDGLDQLAGLARLYALDLSETRVTGSGLAHLAGLKELRYLDLQGTRVDDAGLQRLAGLTIDTVFVRDTAVTPLGAAEFQANHPETSVDRSTAEGVTWAW